jgi:hypothetical protein
MGVSTGAATVSTNAYVPANIPGGDASVVVIANGIASDPVSTTVVTVVPSALTFPSQQIGTTSGQQAVTVFSGSRTLTGISVTNDTGGSADFNTVPRPGTALTPENGQLVITVWFFPTAAGVRNANLEIAYSGAGSPLVVALSGTGNAAPLPLLTASPPSLFFDPKKLTNHQVTLSNIGTGPLTISSIAIDDPNYSLSNTCNIGPEGGILNPGQQCTVNLVCHFEGPGGSSLLVIKHNAVGSPTEIGLEATSKAGGPQP